VPVRAGDAETGRLRPAARIPVEAPGDFPARMAVGQWCARRLGICVALFALLPGALTATEELDLSGTWQFRLDPDGLGQSQRWFEARLTGPIRLPGSIQEQGIGDDITAETPWVGFYDMKFPEYPYWYDSPLYEKYRTPGNIVFPYWLQPKKHYLGLAWFQRSITIPQDWAGQTVSLHLERCHWRTRGWIDGYEIGHRDSLSVPHVYDAISGLTPGEHTLTLAVDNRMIHDVGGGAHAVTDYTQSAWNGIVGHMFLRAETPLRLTQVEVFPDIARKQVRIKAALEGADAGAALDLQATAYNTSTPHSVASRTVPIPARAGASTVEVIYALGEQAQPWDEFHPALYRLKATLRREGQAASSAASREISFGLREISTAGTQFLVNGRKTFLRGTLECCVFPLTGYPPTDAPSWRRIMGIARNYGLNHLRFHSWCPPEAAFIAADEAGIYLQPEAPFWTTIGTPGAENRDYFLAEWDRIRREFGNHPSFALYAIGNEGRIDFDFAAQVLAATRADDPRHLYTGFANGSTPRNSDFDIEVSLSKGFPNPERLRQRIRMQGAWPPAPAHHFLVTRRPDTLLDFDPLTEFYGKPLIQHETVQRNSYPRIADIAKYTGAFSPGYLRIARDQLEANGLLAQNDAFVTASGKWQVQQFKAELEAALNTRGFGGFQMLGLHDFPGQGTALVGVLDAFWDAKGYCPPEVFREFCNATVVLARLTKFEWHPDERFGAHFRLAHYGATDLPNAVLEWQIVDANGRAVKSGSTRAVNAPAGELTSCGKVEIDINELPAPAKYTLVGRLAGTPIANRWDFWTYPRAAPLEVPAGVVVSREFDAATLSTLEGGGRVLLVPRANRIAGSLKPGFSSIYWNGPWTNAGEVDTLGLLCDPKHPVFSSFPTDSHSNWQWYDPMMNSKPMILDSLPQGFRPLVQMIDDWNLNRRLGVLLEARMGRGILIVSSIDLVTDIAARPVSRQLRHSVLQYLASENCRPAMELSVEDVRSLLQ